MRNLVLTLLLLNLILAGCARAAVTVRPVGCDSNPKLQTEKSAELLKIVQEDQADRSGAYDAIDWNKVNPRDLQRRIRVADIFAAGCFKTAADYASAAMVYQHGTTADHFYQAFLWANQSVKLGDDSQRWLTAAGLDRYLVQIGQKQLFGTQLGKNAEGKFCVKPVESSFPDSIRIQYVKRGLQDGIANTLKGIGTAQTLQETKDCDMNLKPSPKGSVAGFW